MREYIKPLVIGFVGALLAGIVTFTGYTAYQDHTYVRALIQIELQREQAAKAPPPIPSK